MNVANTAQATGPMTLEQGFQTLKAKMAEANVSTDDLVKTKLDEDGIETEGGLLTDELPPEPALEDNAEAVSADESEAEQTEPDKRPIILPDGSEITVEEARKGYLRQADYTRKAQVTSQKERDLVVREQAMTQQLGGLYQQLASLQERPPSPEQWNRMASEMEPKDFQRAQAYWQNKTSVMAQAQRTIEENNARALQSAKAQAFEALNSGTFEPTWKDAGALKKALDVVSDYWIERGLPADVLDGITHPVIIEVVEESRRYRELQKGKPKAALAVQGKPKPFTPGAKSTASPQSETIRLAQEAFRKNPTPDNAFRYEKAKQGSGR